MESNNSNNNDHNQYSSKLADSTWVPPSNNTPYDTNTSTPLDNQPLQHTTTAANVVVTNSIGNNISPYSNINATPNSLNDDNNNLPKKSYKERYADVKQLFNSPSRAATANGTTISTALSGSSNNRHNMSHNNSRRVETNKTEEVLDNDTPLQRWERRKERKLMERGGAIPSSRGIATEEEVDNKIRGRSRTREYDAPATSRVVINDDGYEERMMDGYQEYDDFGNRTLDRNSSLEYATRRSRTRSPSNVERRHRSRSRTGRSTSRGRGRPDPLDYEEEEEESLRMNDCESSPLYEHHNGRDMNDDNHYYSPSSIDDNHFDNRRNRSRSPVSSRGRRSKSIPTTRRDDSNNQERERKYNNNYNNNSTYADDLKSFTESVIASPTPANATTNDHQRQSVVRTHNDRQYKPYHDDVDDSMMMEQGTPSSDRQHYPDMAVPVSTGGGGVSISSSNYHSDQSQYSSSDIYHHGEQQQSRVRHKASDICRKFTTQRCYRSSNRDDYHSSTIIVKSNNKKRYLWIALSLCGVCIVAAALSIYFLGQKHNDDTVDTIDVLAMKDTIEPSISTQPSNLPTMYPMNVLPTNKPTNHPLSIRDTLIIDYLSSITKGSSNIVNTPQYLARVWILYDDPLRLHLPYANYGSTSSSSSSNSRAGNDGGTEEEEDYVADWESNVAYRIKQRYALATLYYALHIEEGNMIDRGWLGSVADECDFVEGKNGQQRQAWEGVGCDDEGNVRVLMLGKFSFICSVSCIARLSRNLMNL